MVYNKSPKLKTNLLFSESLAQKAKENTVYTLQFRVVYFTQKFIPCAKS